MLPDDVINKAKLYFQQQAELFGREVWLPKKTIPVAEATSFQEKIIIPQKYSSLDALYESIKDCQKCPLGKTRTKFVFGVGNPQAKIVFVGEAPGHDEDVQGEPFVGRAGQLLTKILRAIDLEREDVYICNILKCRPPNNRDPVEEEEMHCEPYLQEQLRLIQPKLIVALGRIAAQCLLKTKSDLKLLRGKVLNYHGTQLIVTYHPAAILRNPGLKRPTWDDFQIIQKLYQNSDV